MDDPGYEAEAVARARRKIDELRSGKVVPRPAGIFHRRIVVGTFVVVLGGALAYVGVMLFRAAAAEGSGADIAGGALLGALFALPGIAIALYGLYLILVSQANTPENAVLLFFQSVASGSARNARRIVVPNDFDDFPREYPADPVLESGGGYGFEGDGFEDYWSVLLRNRLAPTCRVRIADLRVTKQVAPDLAIVEGDLTVTRNTWSWLLLLVGVLGSRRLGGVMLLALVVGLSVTRKRATAPIRKVVWRVGGEWHLLDGAWQGPEERDTRWLEPG